MRIAYLSCDFGVPVFGTKGASVHVRETVAALRGLGHVVKPFLANLASPDGEARDDYTEMPLGGGAADVLALLAQEDAIGGSHLLKEWRSLQFAEYAQKLLMPELQAFRPDFIYERYALFAYAGLELARALKVPLLLEVNAPLAEEQATYRELVLRRTAERLEARIFRAADAVIVVSRELAAYALRLGVPDDRIEVLPNGVNETLMDPAADGAAVRRRYGIDGKRVVGFVGSLKPWHDLDTLLAAARLLHETDERYHLLVVGDGPRMDSIRSRAEPHVTCTGAVPYEHVPACLAALDVAVVPLARDGHSYFSPLKLYEAMAVGRPVIGARIGEIADAIVEGQTGLLYAPGDAEDLARCVREVLDMPGAGAQLGIDARRWVVANRTWGGNARRIGEVAAAQIERRRGQGSSARASADVDAVTVGGS
jgi:glycosyltransferase involved in cell wall biosynthesis